MGQSKEGVPSWVREGKAPSVRGPQGSNYNFLPSFLRFVERDEKKKVCPGVGVAKRTGLEPVKWITFVRVSFALLILVVEFHPELRRQDSNYINSTTLTPGSG